LFFHFARKFSRSRYPRDISCRQLTLLSRVSSIADQDITICGVFLSVECSLSKISALPSALLAELKSSQVARALDRAGNLFAARIYFFYYHIVLPRDNVSPAIRRYSYYIPRLSRPPPACIFLAIFLRQDRTLWLSEVGTTLKKREREGLSLSRSPSWRFPIFTASDLWSPPTELAVKNPMAKRILSSRERTSAFVPRERPH